MSFESPFASIFCTLPVSSAGFVLSICLCPQEAGTLELWISVNRIFLYYTYKCNQNSLLHRKGCARILKNEPEAKC